jgi:hypothetical protein
MAAKVRISLKRGSAMTVNRVAIGNDRLVYAICADKKVPYQYGQSPIVYFGTTGKGVDRIAQSAAYRSSEVLGMHGVKSFEVRVITCGPRQGIKSWKMLERALILGFRAEFGEVPKCNSHGKKMKETREFEVFSRDRIRQVIRDLTEHGEAETREVKV